MRWRAILLGILTVGSAPFWGGSTAFADYTTNPQVLTIPLTPTNWGPGTTTLTNLDPAIIQQFNPLQNMAFGHPGVLTGVEIRVDYEFENTLSMIFYNTSTISVSATVSLSMENPSNQAFLTTAPWTNSQVLTSTGTAMGNQVTFPTQTLNGTVSSPQGGYNAPTTLAKFTGSGTIALPVVATASSTFTSTSGNGYGSSVTNAGATISIIYHYVPEPSSVVLAGLGGLGLFVGVSRKRSRLKELKAA